MYMISHLREAMREKIFVVRLYQNPSERGRPLEARADGLSPPTTLVLSFNSLLMKYGRSTSDREKKNL